MPKGINKVILIGNLGADPEVRYMSSGDAVANIRIATSESWKDKNTGEMQERTEWHSVAFFGKLAEIVKQYLKKGSKVYIEGKLRTRKWQGQDGQDRYTTEIVVDINGTMQMLDSRGGGNGGGGQSQESAARPEQAPPPPRNQNAQESPPSPPSPPFDDDIPF